jgi:hypothetical protein
LALINPERLFDSHFLLPDRPLAAGSSLASTQGYRATDAPWP